MHKLDALIQHIGIDDEVLLHWGVKGMHWGVRRERNHSNRPDKHSRTMDKVTKKEMDRIWKKLKTRYGMTERDTKDINHPNYQTIHREKKAALRDISRDSDVVAAKLRNGEMTYEELRKLRRIVKAKRKSISKK